jgi:long-chain acyl-CoA synthetase
MLTHRALSVASHAYAAEVDPAAPGNAILHAAPMSHGSGLYMMAHVARLAVNVVPESGGFEPDESLPPHRAPTSPSPVDAHPGRSLC